MDNERLPQKDNEPIQDTPQLDDEQEIKTETQYEQEKEHQFGKMVLTSKCYDQFIPQIKNHQRIINSMQNSQCLIKFSNQWERILSQTIRSYHYRLDFITYRYDNGSNYTSNRMLEGFQFLKLITPIQFINLQYITLDNMWITSIEMLVGLNMENLEFLSIQQNKISNIKPLSKTRWKKLKKLYLSQNIIHQGQWDRMTLTSEVDTLCLDSHFQDPTIAVIKIEARAIYKLQMGFSIMRTRRFRSCEYKIPSKSPEYQLVNRFSLEQLNWD